MTRTAYQQFVAPADAQADDGDFNAACSMVYRWWSLLEAPVGTNTANFLQGFADADVSIQLPELGINMTGLTATTWLAVGRGNTRHSYSVRDDAFQLSYLGGGIYRLQAPFVWHSQTADGRSQSGQGQCDHLFKKIGPARMRFTRILEQRGGVEWEGGDFESSYRLHRIKAVLLQWQANMDTLNGDSSGLEELVMPEMEFHGLISAKKDHSQRREGVVKDFTEMKGMLAGTDGKEETVIRGFDGVTQWFATGPSLLKRNIHRAERLEITPVSADRFRVVAQFGWYAETLNGAEIELHQPLEWTIVERGEKYMRLEKLWPHTTP